MEPLLSNGLCIRPYRDADVPAYVEAVKESAESVGAWLPWCHAGFTETEAKNWFHHCFAQLQAGAAYDLGLFSDASGELLGSVAINHIDRDHNLGNIGYWVRHTQQRKGIALRAVRIIVDFGFRNLGLTRLDIVTASHNHPSRRLAESLGAHLECIARNRLVVRGELFSAAVYSLIPESR